MFNVEYLNQLRAEEISRIVRYFPSHSRILEVGAGTGQQAQELVSRGFTVEAIELAGSNYAKARVFPITDFDGRRIPFPDASFDIVFSSNVLEHISDLAQMHKEIARVLRPSGRAVHVLPTHAWRIWTTLSAFPASLQIAAVQLRHPPNLRGCWGLPALRPLLHYVVQVVRPLSGAILQRRHGERGNLLTEAWYFRPVWWRRNFEANGFEIVSERPLSLFYTGNMVFAQRWSWTKRAKLAAVLGSACHIFELRPR